MCRSDHLNLDCSDVIQALRSAPEGLRARLAATSAVEGSAQGGDAMHRIMPRRWRIGVGGPGKDHQRPPLRFLEVHVARCLWGRASELGQALDPLHHY